MIYRRILLFLLLMPVWLVTANLGAFGTATWPSFPAVSANNFLDHFDSSLDSRWTSVTSGTGAVTTTDSTAQLASPSNSAAFIYRNTQIDKTKSQLWTMSTRLTRASGTASYDTVVALVNGASAPAADTTANIEAKTLVTIGLGGGSEPTQFHPWYYDSGGTQTYYNRSSNTWTTTYPGADVAITQARKDDYYTVGIEIDGINTRWRLIFWNQSFASAGTYEFSQGWRIFVQTPWVTWANTRSNSNVWLVIGRPNNDVAADWTANVEWVRYAEARTGNKVIDAWVASRNNADSHEIRHIYSYDGLTFVQSFTDTWTLELGAGSPDDTEINDPRAAWDGSTTDYIYYMCQSGASRGICVASATHVSAETGQTATFSKYGSNPILSLGTSGAFDDQQIGFHFVFKDEVEADSNKRWKMLYGAQKASNGVRSYAYATAPNATGTWTKQGAVITLSSSQTTDDSKWSGILVRYGGQWEFWYEDHLAADGTSRLRRATGTDLASLTPDGQSYHTAPTDAREDLTANLTASPGRTVTVASTTGFTKDASVIFSQSTGLGTYSTSKIRKVLSSTQLELYHGVTGFTTTYPARIVQVDNTPTWSPRDLRRVGNEWWLYMTVWEPFLFSPETATYAAVLEETYLFTHSASSPSGGTFTLSQQVQPVTSRNEYNGQVSFENFTLLIEPFTGDAAGGLLLRGIGGN